GPACASSSAKVVPVGRPAGPEWVALQPPLQVLRQSRSRAVTASGFLAQALQANRLQVAIQAPTGRTRSLRLLLDNPPESLLRGLPLKGRASGQQVVENGP